MSLTATEIKKIEKEADAMLAKANITTPGVPVEQLARERGLHVIPYDLGAEISGVLVVAGGVGTIGFNPKDPKGRQRFTIAHELAHHVLHVRPNSQDELFVDSKFLVKYRKAKPYTEVERKQEWEANAFAAALLMPESLVTAELEKDEYNEVPELELIDKLAKVFGVSTPAMTYRLANLNIF